MKKEKKHILLYDGRHGIVSQQVWAPLQCILLDKKKRLVLKTECINELPLLHPENFRNRQHHFNKPLWQLLGCQPYHDNNEPITYSPDPQTTQDLIDYLQHYAPAQNKVIVEFAPSPKKVSLNLWYETPILPLNIRNVIYIEARAGPDYCIVYSKKQFPGEEADIQRGQKIEQDYARYRYFL